MDDKILRNAIAELRKQKAHLDRAIDMLEALETGAPRRGRPPKLLSEASRTAKPAGMKQAATKKSRKKTNRVKPPSHS
jgi:hypothetical protein